MSSLALGIELIDDPAWMGGTLYLRNLATCLLRMPAGERPLLRLLGTPSIVAQFEKENAMAPGSALGPAQGWRRLLPKRVRVQSGNTIDVVYPGFGAPVPGAVTMRWIPDLQHRQLPELFSAEEIAARDAAIGDIANQTGVVVLSSRVAEADFRRYYPALQATPRVWHFCSLIETTAAPAELPEPIARSIPEKFLYLPNQFWVHKNHITVLKALALLRRDRGLVIPLVCTGAQSDRRNAAHFDGLLDFIRTHQLVGQVHLLGLIDRQVQVGILRRAAAIVQPSRFEGWSTVVEDVRATGRPIFLSDLPVHREQAPEHCVYFAAESETGLADALETHWNRLQPGPDLAAEAAARLDMQTRIRESARQFCEIARAAVRLGRT